MDLSGGQDLLNRDGMDEDPVARGANLKDEEMRQPGWAWNNKKARDEYGRAMEQVVDKSFNLRRFYMGEAVEWPRN